MANRFWVGGTGTWDASSTTHWASVTNGAGGASVPGSADNVTFDGSSGGGTITVNTTVNVTSITMGAFTGTLDFSANNNNVTLSTFSGTGTATRTLNMGNGTWTVTGTATAWNCLTTTGFTFNANSSTIVFTATTALSRNITGGALSYNIINVSPNTSGGVFQFNTVATTYGTVTISGPNYVLFGQSQTTVLAALTANGSAAAPISLKSSSDGSAATLSIASNAPTLTWATFRDLTCTGGATFAANNSFDLGHNTGITINPPNPPVGQFVSAQRGTPY